MARTNPHHDWTEPASATARSNGTQWESLRNELVALLDQVEDHVVSSQPPSEAAMPKPQPASPARRDEALRSVHQAVARLADRANDDKPAIRDSVVEAISQIRARQTQGAEAPAPASVQAHAGPDVDGLAQSLDVLGERIGKFETQIAARLETLDNLADISGQIAQLSDVIEMLAAAVGETGQVRRIEAQIGNLTEMLVNDRTADTDTSAARIEQLTEIVEKLVTHQIESEDREARQATEGAERQARSMELIEHSVRAIYERIDALESAQAEPAFIERLSRDMAALSEAVETNREPQSLLDKIDALHQRIGMIDTPDRDRDETDTLAQSLGALRDVIADTVEPRFDALENRLDALANRPQPDTAEAIETQLRAIAQRVEETSAQLKAMSLAADTGAGLDHDIDALAERIVERAGALAPRPVENEDSIGKADLAALEERLSALFSRSGTLSASATRLEGVKGSVNQVGDRISRLEALLDDRPERPASAKADPVAPAAAATPAPAPAPRRPVGDAMPQDPATGDAQPAQEPETALSFDAAPAPAEALPPAPEPEVAARPFTIDPQSIERPVKPLPSFAAAKENAFEPAPREASAPASTVAATTRLSFIEAARRSARHPEPEADEPKSLIARALARFQRGENELAAEPETQESAPPPVHAEPELAVEPDLLDEAETEPRPGFIARNRRALLLGTALVVAVALAVPLVLDRGAPSAPDAPGQAALAPSEAAPETVNPPVEAGSPAQMPEVVDEGPAVDNAPADEQVSVLTSGVPVLEQQTDLTAAHIDASTLSGELLLDPIRTAAIPDETVLAAAASAPTTSAALPAIAVPEGIEPAALRMAAESGDRHAQFEIGAILTEGTVIEQDFAQAAAWYERSAGQGFVPAQYRLGSLFESGRGVERDLEMSRLWYQRAAEAGNRMSMHNLASLYAGGELDSQDFAAAAHWFEQAAERGLTDSQFNLGMLYARGLGVEQDFEQSYVWFSLAARAGDQDAAEARDNVAGSLDSATVQELDNAVSAWTPVDFDLAANFAPIGTWDEAFDPGPVITNSDVVMQVQVLLSKLGFEIGTPDGIAGPKTREAIAAFETETGMSASGAVNPRLLAVLGSQPV